MLCHFVSNDLHLVQGIVLVLFTRPLLGPRANILATMVRGTKVYFIDLKWDQFFTCLICVVLYKCESEITLKGLFCWNGPMCHFCFQLHRKKHLGWYQSREITVDINCYSCLLKWLLVEFLTNSLQQECQYCQLHLSCV